MKRINIVGYVVFLLAGWFIAMREYDRMNHAAPKGQLFGIFPPETIFFIPPLLLLGLHYLLEWVAQRKAPEGVGVPMAIVFIANPKTSKELTRYNYLHDEGIEKYILYVNASRTFRQKSRGQRIVKVAKFKGTEKTRFDNTMFYDYIYGDNLSQAEIANYIINEGQVVLWAYDYRLSLTHYPQLIDVGNMRIVEMRGIPKTLDETAISLYSSGYSGEANKLIESRYGNQNIR